MPSSRPSLFIFPAVFLVASLVPPASGQVCIYRDLRWLTAGDPAAYDEFGTAVSMTASWAFVGAPYDSLPHDSGSVYVFLRWHNNTPADPYDDTWPQMAKLTASDVFEGANFGIAVAHSPDWAVIGAPAANSGSEGTGAAYLFWRDDNGTASQLGDDVWNQLGKLSASDAAQSDLFGSSVSISGDRIIIGAPGDVTPFGDTGSAYVFRHNDNGTPANPGDDFWIEEAKLIASDGGGGDSFGHAVAIDGDRAIVGAPLDDDRGTDSGSAYFFRRDDNGTPSDPGDDSWTGQEKFVGEWDNGSKFGYSVSMSGVWAVVGVPESDDSCPYWGPDCASGVLYTYRFDDNVTPEDAGDDYWVFMQTIGHSEITWEDWLGYSVSINGDWIFAGAPGSNVASFYGSGIAYAGGNTHLFRREQNDTPLDPSDDFWTERAVYVASNASWMAKLGMSVSIYGDSAIAGVPLDNTSGSNAGSARVFSIKADLTEDCNCNFALDSTDIAEGISEDCNGNGVPDECDLAQGTSNDCNGDDIPDECANDCNGNGMDDLCDILIGTSYDCNTNDTPDECETDCNGNGIPDDCDILNGTSQDCTGNGVLDECEPDCNLNGLPDDCDILDGVSMDCNTNAIPDECDLLGGTSEDCNGNEVPDECEMDCNNNGLDDACDIAAGTSEDCQLNGVPDECDADCNGNGIPDDCDIANGLTLSCGIIEFAPAGSSGPFQIDGVEMIIPGGGVQVEYEVLVWGWGNAPESPSLSAYNLAFERESLLGSNAVPPAPGVDLTLPLAVPCVSNEDCPEPAPPLQGSQTGTCGVMFSGWCDDFNAAYFVPRVCSDDLVTPCWGDEDCSAGITCVSNPRFVFPIEMQPWLGVMAIGGNSFQWMGFPLVAGESREDPDGVTKYLTANLRFNVPAEARGSYAIQFRSGADFTFLVNLAGVVIPSALIHGRLLIGGACCMSDDSCTVLLEGECADEGGTYAGGFCIDQVQPCTLDCNDNGVVDGADISSGTSLDCNHNGIPDECEFDGNDNGIPDECELVPTELPANPKHQHRKHRYLSIKPNTNPTRDTVLKVEVADMMRCLNDPRRACLGDADCPMICAGGNPRNTLCAGGQTACDAVGEGACISSGPCIDATPSPPLAWLVDEPTQIQAGCKAPGCDAATQNCCGDEDWVAPLTNVGYVSNWQEHDLIHISGCAIVPSTTYAVYACDPANFDICSEPLYVGTQRTPSITPRHFGDIAAPPLPPNVDYRPPDGVVGVADIDAWVRTFERYGTLAAPQLHPTMVDIHGPGIGIPPQYILGVSDLQAILNHAFTDQLPWGNPTGLGGVDPPACPYSLP